MGTVIITVALTLVAAIALPVVTAVQYDNQLAARHRCKAQKGSKAIS